MDYLELIARVTSHIPDKCQVMVRYHGPYANAHRGKVKKANLSSSLRVAEEEFRRIPSKGWAEMIRKVHEVGPLVCPRCGHRMKVVAFLTACAVVPPDYRSSATDICCREAPAGSSGLSGMSLGRRSAG